ncbi:hypothetical protein DPMN_087191 [Dreissena polymorpha]|uniref:Uncharacterized protein n=1 Tax=Dreissena polymorpha TaxID=45954 RepID=A0A9D4KRY6_DREPO|nr:hypothetical protein DPMN_087191 [Dreissena polymorpha]
MLEEKLHIIIRKSYEGDYLQHCSWQRAHCRLRRKKRSEARLLNLTFSVPVGHRLDSEDLKRQEAERNPMDTGYSLVHQTTFVEKDTYGCGQRS